MLGIRFVVPTLRRGVPGFGAGGLYRDDRALYAPGVNWKASGRNFLLPGNRLKRPTRQVTGVIALPAEIQLIRLSTIS